MSQCWVCKCIISRSTENRSQSELTNVKSALDSDSASELELAPAIQVRGFGRFINHKKARSDFPLANHWHPGRTVQGIFSGSSEKISSHTSEMNRLWNWIYQHLKHSEFNTAVNRGLPVQRGKLQTTIYSTIFFSLSPALKFRLVVVPYPC